MAFLTFLFVIFIASYFRQRHSTDIFRRMRRHTATEMKSNQKTNETVLEGILRFIRQISKPLENKSFLSALDLKLRQAGIPLLGTEFIVANLLFASAVGILVYMLSINKVLAILIALFVPMGIWLAVLFLIRKRKNSFTEQLGDCLITFANALRAGYSFQQAMDVIAKEMESPIAQEFERASKDIKMGVPLETALEQMNSRVESADFTLVVTAVLIQREVGGNLAQILDTISDTIMERIRMKREINALTSQGKLSATVLLILPFAIGAFTFLVNPQQMEIFFEDPTGQMAIAAAIVMDIIGYLVIQKIVNIDV